MNLRIRDVDQKNVVWSSATMELPNALVSVQDRKKEGRKRDLGVEGSR
jgi:hypothetical protein